MSVYVDDLVDYGVTYGSAGPEWCHMTADSAQELHDFAAQLGLRRSWFQGDHYDLTKNKRRQAVNLGATPVDTFKIVDIINASDMKGARIRRRT